MDYVTLQEESWKRGFEAGFIKGKLDEVAAAMNNAIVWHEGIPLEDKSYCLILQNNGGRKYTIRPAVFKKHSGVYFVEDYTEDGTYVQTRIAEEDVRWWAEVKLPFQTRVSFTVPEAK